MDYESEVRKKNSELQGFSKNQLKDSIRVALIEMGIIHAKYGFCSMALSMWEKAYDACSSEDD